MTFIRARRTDLTSLFWADLQDDLERNPRDDVPDAIGELARGDRSIVCDVDEAAAAMAWARAQPYWPAALAPEHEPLYVVAASTE